MSSCTRTNTRDRMSFTSISFRDIFHSIYCAQPQILGDLCTDREARTLIQSQHRSLTHTYRGERQLLTAPTTTNRGVVCAVCGCDGIYGVCASPHTHSGCLFYIRTHSHVQRTQSPTTHTHTDSDSGDNVLLFSAWKISANSGCSWMLEHFYVRNRNWMWIGFTELVHNVRSICVDCGCGACVTACMAHMVVHYLCMGTDGAACVEISHAACGENLMRKPMPSAVQRLMRLRNKSKFIQPPLHVSNAKAQSMFDTTIHNSG